MAIEHAIDSWRRRAVIRILLLVATLIEDDATARDQIQDLANHLSAGF